MVAQRTYVNRCSDANHLKTGWLPTTAGAQAVDMFARKVSMHLKGSVPEFTETLEGKSFPSFENRRDSGTKSHLSHRKERKHLASVCKTGPKTRKATTVELTPKWRRPWRRRLTELLR